jgi:ACS family glucarate transporter-like MFS transporter
MPRQTSRQTRARYLVLLALFVVSTINFGDRAAMAVAGPAVSATLHLDPVAMGYVLAAFAISYVVAQVPGGVLLDRYGSRWIYTGALALWSLFILVQGWAGLFSGLSAAILLFVMRFLEGIASAPSVPANARIAASWFPASERGLATAIFNASQYFSLVAFAPLMGWLVHRYGWPWVFFVMGGLGLAAAAVLPFVVRSPLQSPLINVAELAYIERGGALVHIERRSTVTHFTWQNVRQLIVNRMLLGVYLGQYCVGVLTYFFVTWFPIYLVQQRGLSILKAGLMTAVPAICGFAGGISGGVLSDAILRRTGSLTAARKAPVLIGMTMAALIVACNFTTSQAAVIVLMSIAFFGKGLAALGWTVISDVSPKELVGVTGGVFNTVSNVPGIVTPIVIGYTVARLGSFDWALAFVAAHCLIAIFAYFVVVQKIERLELAPPADLGK